jgi:hypothetical protein
MLLANGGSNTSQSGFKFVDLLFDTIILEIATSSRTNKTGPQSGQPKYVLATLNGLAACFRIAEETCRSHALEVSLRQAGLSREDNVEKYITAMQRPNPVYMVRSEAEDDDDDDDDDDVAGALTKWELLQSTQGLMVPVICEADTSWFNERYRRSTPDCQDMIARIIYKLRATLWGVMASTSASESVVHYSSVHHKATTSTVKTPRTLNPSNPPRKAKEPVQNGVRAAFITQKLDGLNIMVDSHRKTFGLQGQLKLKLVEPVSTAYSTIGVAMMMLYQVPSIASRVSIVGMMRSTVSSLIVFVSIAPVTESRLLGQASGFATKT